MYRLTRGTGRAVAAAALVAGLTAACSDSSTASKAPQPSEAASSGSATPTARPASGPDRERLNKEARDLLDPAHRPATDEKGFVSAGSLAVPGMNVDKTITSGTALRVEVACAGEGTVTFTVTSGTAKAAKRVDCARSPRDGFDFTTAGSSLAIHADSSEEESVGTAYLVSRAS
ncbi:hypothetical protein [Streptomyces sp. CC219B]|uniref:hypothetical protein n=1 Tax=Streptomyces sp. CC219B TaxID=3044574 RepID=UPI0024A9157C|nr:hypothetical protein [Streptomyces sp. CC219B]